MGDLIPFRRPMTTPKTRIHLYRVETGDTADKRSPRVWVAFTDAGVQVRGGPADSKADVLDALLATANLARDAAHVVRYEGTARMSELVMHLAECQIERERKEEI